MSDFTSKLNKAKDVIQRRWDEAPEQVAIAAFTIITLVAKASNDFAGVKSKRAYARLHGKKK